MSNGLSAATANSERVFVGAILNGDARALDSGLKAADFTDGFCGRVFSTALTLEERGQICDLVTLSDIAPDIDASAAVDLTVEALGRGALAGQYAASVKAAAQRRAVVELCLTLARDAQDADKPLPETRWRGICPPAARSAAQTRSAVSTRGWLAARCSPS